MRLGFVTSYMFPHLGGIERIAENLFNGYVAQGVEVRWVSSRIPPSLAPREGARIRVPCVNVVENALKFSEPAQSVDVDLRVEHGRARVRVVDHGIGLDPTEISRLFAKYSRLRSARSFTGIGLGLYYAQLAVQAHGGAISAHSAGPGHGATFDVQLPLAQQPLAESASRD